MLFLVIPESFRTYQSMGTRFGWWFHFADSRVIIRTGQKIFIEPLAFASNYARRTEWFDLLVLNTVTERRAGASARFLNHSGVAIKHTAVSVLLKNNLDRH